MVYLFFKIDTTRHSSQWAKIRKKMKFSEASIAKINIFEKKIERTLSSEENVSKKY